MFFPPNKGNGIFLTGIPLLFLQIRDGVQGRRPDRSRHVWLRFEPSGRIMKKSAVTSHNLGSFPSPGTSNYGDGSGGVPKGWSSERVAPSVNSGRRYIGGSTLMPFNSGRALPSKWEDAERWISSPVSGYSVNKSSLAQPQRRPKSKSGPLGLPGVAYNPNYSPAMPVFDGGGVRNFMGPSSPFSTGVMVAEGLSLHYGAGNGGQPHPVPNEHSMERSISIPGWSDFLSESSSPNSQDEKLGGSKDAETMVSPVVSRRDIATQMSPDSNTHSSPKDRFSFPPSPLLPTLEQQTHSVKSEVRDVQVDKGVTMIRWSKKHGAKTTMRAPPDVEETDKNAAEAQASSWDIAEPSKNILKLKREEAKITAWENLQKAKAEAAIQKLEMKLEKKRAASMDKILSKLRMAEMKAEEMRSSISESQANQDSKTSHKVASFRKNVQKGSLGGCFTCHAV